MARKDSRKLSIEKVLPVVLTTAGSIGVLPFAIIRIRNAEWVIAGFDVAVIAALTFLGLYVYRTRKIRVASGLIAIICVVGSLATVYMNGVQSVYWIYPAIVIVFYLVRPREAIVISAICVAGLYPAIAPSLPGFELATVLTTLIVSGAFAYAFSTVSRSQRRRLHLLATEDPLTGAGNRRALDAKIDAIVAAHERTNMPASMLLLDLDHFKQVNDAYGHAVGDRILVRLAEVINLRIRVTDSLYRIGGEEFVVVVDGQDIDKAARLAEQLRTLVEANELAPNQAVTISIGVAQLNAEEPGDNWLRRADDALYKAKRAGRNTTKLAA